MQWLPDSLHGSVLDAGRTLVARPNALGPIVELARELLPTMCSPRRGTFVHTRRWVTTAMRRPAPAACTPPPRWFGLFSDANAVQVTESSYRGAIEHAVTMISRSPDASVAATSLWAVALADPGRAEGEARTLCA